MRSNDKLYNEQGCQGWCSAGVKLRGFNLKKLVIRFCGKIGYQEKLGVI